MTPEDLADLIQNATGCDRDAAWELAQAIIAIADESAGAAVAERIHR